MTDSKLPQASAIERVLVFRPDHIGDMILTTPLIRALRMGFPGTHLAVLSGSWSRDILVGNDDVDEVIPCDLPGMARYQPAPWGLALATLAWIRQRRFDLVVDTRTACSTALYSLMAGGRIRLGYDGPKCRWAFNRKIPLPDHLHVVDASLDLAASIGCPRPRTPRLMLYPDASARLGADLLLSGVKEPFVILHQGAGHCAKLWNPKRWAETADWVAGLGFEPVLSGNHREREQVEDIRRQMSGSSHNIAGRCDLPTYAEIVSRAHLMISVDSAPVHVAAAMQTPVVALFGPTDSRRWGPYPNGCHNQVLDKKQTPWTRGSGDPRCMAVHQVGEVASAVEQVLGSLASASSSASIG